MFIEGGDVISSNIIYILYFSRSILLPTQRVVRLNSNSALKSKTDYLNRLVHLPQESSAFDTTSLVHSGAMQYLKSLRKELLTHDFLVVDVILQEAALRSISRLLLSSTVWFDVTNGAAFAAHHDEGLVFPAVHSLVQVKDILIACFFLLLWFNLLFFSHSVARCTMLCVLASGTSTV